MAPRTRRLVILAALALVLAATATTALRQWWPASGSAVASSQADAPAGSDAAAAIAVEDVRLDALEAPRPALVEGDRNPFRFSPPAAPPRPAPPAPIVPPAGAGPRPGVPTAGGGVPPIALKFIGIVDAPTQGGKVAVLSDGRAVFQGHEGDAIDGRFRIVRIGVESIEMAYLDGRGRQTIRLTGQ